MPDSARICLEGQWWLFTHIGIPAISVTVVAGCFILWLYKTFYDED